MNGFTRHRGYIVLSLAFAILFGGYVLWDRWPRAEPVLILEAPASPTAAALVITPSPALTATPEPVRVHVAGAVQRAGVYTLAADSRLIDAVQAAGGLSADADPLRINLADFVFDGQQIVVPYQQTPLPPSPTAVRDPLGPSRAQTIPEAVGGQVNINTASAAELETLPGIGPTYAERIIAYRQEQGPFVDIAEIMEVKGIGPACFEQIKDRITTD